MDKLKTGEMIRNARMQKGYTQKELGDMIGVSNKAVSRWENGESFPDIAMLDSLSNALELTIEEIVLGEKNNEDANSTVKEIIQVAKIQKKQITKNITYIAIGIGVLFLLILRGYNTLISAVSDCSSVIYFYSLGVVLLLIMIKAIQEPGNSLKSNDKFSRLSGIISFILGSFAAVTMLLLMKVVQKGVTPFGIEEAAFGPMMNQQFIVSYILILLIIGGLFWKVINQNDKITVSMYISVAALHLILIYSDLLHRLTSPRYFEYIFTIDTVAVIGVTVVMILCTLLLKKKFSK